MKLTNLKAAVLAAGFAAMASSTALAADVKATMIIYLDPSVQFFNPVVKGAQDAAAQFGVDLDVQYANNDPVRQNDLIESATASGVDGIAVAISSSDAFDSSICAAVKAGIIVIGFNNDDLEGAKGNCRQAYVGMNEFASGYELGQRMMAVIEKYAKDNGYTMILDVGNANTPVLYASSGIDITQDIVQLYDKSSANGGPAPTSAAPATPRTPGSPTGSAVQKPGTPR